jgi:predicted ATPase
MAVEEANTRGVLDVTGGNPLFVREVARAIAEGTWRPDQPPRTVLDVVSARLDRVSAGCRKLVQAAAMVGRDFSVALVAAALDEPAALCLPLIDEAIKYGLLERASEHGGYRVHPRADPGRGGGVARHCRPGGTAPPRRRGDPGTVRR